jgi:predicted DNA-binding transcriptional regulator
MRVSGKIATRDARGRTKKPTKVIEIRNSPPLQMPSMSAQEALSFLKETRGVITWTVEDMARSLKISQLEARQIIVILELQGYVKPALDDEGWLTTLDGETVSGSKIPRFTPERMKAALGVLEERIKANNRDRNAAFRIADAVAFGDFLSDRPQVQAADVGVRLVARKNGAEKPLPSESAFLKQLRARSSLVRLHVYQPWMRSRSNRPLV